MRIWCPEVRFECFPELWTRLRSGSNFGSWRNLGITTEHIQPLSATGSQLPIFIDFALFYTWIKFFPNTLNRTSVRVELCSWWNLGITTEHVQPLSATGSQLAIFIDFALFYTWIKFFPNTLNRTSVRVELWFVTEPRHHYWARSTFECHRFPACDFHRFCTILYLN